MEDDVATCRGDAVVGRDGLHKYHLEYAAAWAFVEDNLDQVNTLSNELLKNVTFTNGHFYALLPQNAHLERLYHFKEGGILIQNPILEYEVNGRKSTYSIIPTVKKEVSEILLQCMNKNERLKCVFDDVNSSPKVMLRLDPLNSYRWIHNKEVYLIFDHQSISKDKIVKGMHISQAFWHSLCVLSDAYFKRDVNGHLSFEQMRNICLEAQLIMVGAYDGEGYVFWEKKNEPNNGMLTS